MCRRASPWQAAVRACAAPCPCERAARSRTTLRPRGSARSASGGSAPTRSALASARTRPPSSRPRSCLRARCPSASTPSQQPPPTPLPPTQQPSPLRCGRAPSASPQPAARTALRAAGRRRSRAPTTLLAAHRAPQASRRTPASDAASHATACVPIPNDVHRAGRGERPHGDRTTAPAPSPAMRRALFSSANSRRSRPHRALATGSTAAPAG